jgi:hypothetical protein
MKAVMKTLRTLCLVFAAIFAGSAWAADAPAPSKPEVGFVKGEVVEVKDVSSYTYLRLKTHDGPTWVAVDKAVVAIGAQVRIENVMRVDNFESKALKQTFPEIFFGHLAGADAVAADPHAGVERVSETGPIQVAKASGANAHTVAEIVSQAKQLKDQAVRVRGKVVKYNAEIMGKNWIHLRDGSGAAAQETHDILVTTTGVAKIGDVVTVTGIVRTDKDFGSGYFYPVLVEDAALER